MTPGPPIARVCVDTPLPHLDRLFDYAIPDALRDAVAVGTRVRVRFAGRLIDGVVCERGSRGDFDGELAPLRTAAAVPSYTPDALTLARDVANRYGGNLWDVLRLMAPPRVAAVERRGPGAASQTPLPVPQAARDALTAAWDAWGGAEALESFADGARAVWEALPEPGTGMPARALVGAAVAAADGGGSAIVVVPDARAIDAVVRAARESGLRRWSARGGGDVAVIHTGEGRSARYGAYLAAMRGEARIVVGTRPAVLTPVPDLRGLLLWDDGNSAYEERHAPHPHALAVAAMRADRGSGLIAGGFAVSVAARALVEHGWARSWEAPRDVVRRATPAVTALGPEARAREGGVGAHWMPGSAWRAARDATGRGAVLVLVPRAGYVRATACAGCRAWAECRTCGGGLALDSGERAPRCLDCGAENINWHCPECGDARLAHVRQGVERIAEQLSAMAAGVEVSSSSSGSGILDDGAVGEGIVVATPGAVPSVEGGYAHAVLVDAGALVGSGLDGEADALRLALNAAAFVRSRADGGGVTVVGRLPEPVARSLATWSPTTWAAGQYSERSSLGLPPARRVVSVSGEEGALIRFDSSPLGSATVATHPEVRRFGGRLGARTYVVTRKATQALVDAARTFQIEASRAGEPHMHLRVDGSLAAAG